MSASATPAEPEELSLRELTRLYRDLVRQHLDTHQVVYALKKFVHDEHVVPELEELDDRVEKTEGALAALRSSVEGFGRDLGKLRSSQEALITIASATSSQLIAIAQHWGIPVVGGLSE